MSKVKAAGVSHPKSTPDTVGLHLNSQVEPDPIPIVLLQTYTNGIPDGACQNYGLYFLIDIANLSSNSFQIIGMDFHNFDFASSFLHS